MSKKVIYKTKQRSELLEYLETVPGEHITVADVCTHFQGRGVPIGQTTVYRQLEKLVDEGLVNKYIIDGVSSACFEYVPPESHGNAETCFHCKCERCGALIHLHCDELTAIQNHLWEEHRFRLDPLRTVFYGLCDTCASPK